MAVTPAARTSDLIADAILPYINTNCIIKVFGGTKPAVCDPSTEPTSGSELVSFTVSTNPAKLVKFIKNAATGGSSVTPANLSLAPLSANEYYDATALNSTPPSTTVLWCRLYSNTTTTNGVTNVPLFDFVAGTTAGSDVILNTTSITQNGPVRLVSFVITMPA